MIIIFVVILTFSWLKEKISCDHFKNGASKWPNVCRRIIIGPDYDFRRPVLPGLDLRSKMMVSPTAVTHITNFYHHIFVDFSASFIVLCLEFFFHFLNSLFCSVGFLWLFAFRFGIFLNFFNSFLFTFGLFLLCRLILFKFAEANVDFDFNIPNFLVLEIR